MPIYNLNKTNHKEIVSKIIPFNKTVIYYYSKQCPYCVMLEGLWKDIKKKYNNTDKIIIYIERDNMKKYLETKYQINLVPCIQYYDKGKKKSDFLKKREYENIIKFIEKSLN
jgi:thiol-disulfide isomerase/thioredoxin